MMDKWQIESAYKTSWTMIETMYQAMVKRARWARDPAALEWAKAWWLMQLQNVCRVRKAHLDQLEQKSQ